MNSNQNNNRGKGGGNKRNMTAIVSILLWALVLTLLVNLATSRLQQANSVEVSYGQFRQLIMQDAVESVVMSSGKYTFTLKEGYSLSVGEDGEVTVRTPEEGGQDSQAAQAPQESGTTGGVLDLPLLDGTAPQQQPVQSQNQAQSAGGRESLVYFCAPITQASIRDDDLVSLLEEHGVTNFGPEYVEPINPILSVLLSWVLPMVLIMVVFSLLMRGMAGKMGGGIGNLGKSNAKVYVERKTGVTFKDVAGQDEAKESLVEIIDFLHNPQKYTEIGAKLPKGALLVGPPGTGKTLLAKAVAGEANVPFFSISGSDFVEMFVGMGAARVRDLFKEANKMAPCIVFIDEIDTIGKSRDNRMGGNDEREQTLNQLLAEMDGFDPTKGVILLAATNRPEVLDQALLRPGRFDRRIIVDRPNLAGRLATLQVHTRNIRLAEDVNLRKIAIATAGTVGADLANLVNEAALRAVRLGRKAVNQEDLLAAFELVIAGAEKKGSVLSEFEKKLVAYHEVGHAMVAYRQKHAEPVSKITIVPHTQGALGYTLHLPEEDKHLHTRDELLAQITVSMGGRVAEELVLHTMTNGAAQDIQDATGIARNMVAMFGMSDEFGMMALASRRSQYLDGGYGIDCAQDTAAAMDRAVRDLIDACYKKAVEILSHSREDMDKVVEYLLEKETITGAEMVAILEGRDPALADGRMWQVEERGVAALGEDGTFCWRFRAVPEVEAPRLGLSVTAEGGGERFTARADRDGLAYEAELRLPLGEEYRFTLRTSIPSGAEYRQELGEWTVTAEALAPLELTVRKGKGGTLSGGIWTWDGSIWAACVPPEGSLVTVERAVLRQYRNGAPEWEQSLPVEHGRLEADVSDFQRQTRVEEGDEVLLLVEAVDSLGRTCTSQVEGAAFSDGPSGLEWAAFP